MKIYYNPKLKQLARNLRNNSTLSEVLLWNQLKQKQILGYQFYRQKPISEYIVDFFCAKLKLVIEIDGESHFDRENQDNKRTLFLESLGLSVIRFGDNEVKQDLENVLNKIEYWIKTQIKESNRSILVPLFKKGDSGGFINTSRKSFVIRNIVND